MSRIEAALDAISRVVMDDWIAAWFLAVLSFALIGGFIALGLWITREFWR